MSVCFFLHRRHHMSVHFLWRRCHHIYQSVSFDVEVIICQSIFIAFVVLWNFSVTINHCSSQCSTLPGYTALLVNCISPVWFLLYTHKKPTEALYKKKIILMQKPTQVIIQTQKTNCSIIQGGAKKRSHYNIARSFFKNHRFSWKFVFWLWNEARMNYHSKFVFKLSTNSFNTQTKSLTPFADCFINYTLNKFFHDFKMRSCRLSTSRSWIL